MATTSRRSGAVSTKAKRKAAPGSGPGQAVARPPARLQAKKQRRGTGIVLPDWQELGSSAGSTSRKKAGGKAAKRRAAAKSRLRALDATPSLRFGLIATVVCVIVVLFVGHVYATSHTLDALQEARRTNDRLRLTHQRLKGDFDKMTGPSAVMPRAAALGLEEGVAYGPPIHIER